MLFRSSLLNPINHGASRTGIHRYKVEPYVVAADVYAAADHIGRGGWTWYTGSAGWMHRAGLEGILGLHIQGSSLHLDPCIPKGWPGFEITIRRRSASFHITVTNPDGVVRGVASARMDGTVIAERPLRIELMDDGRAHELEVMLG